MPNRIKVVDIELSRPLSEWKGLEGYQSLQGLIRWQGTPLGYVQLPVVQGTCSATAIAQAVLPYYTWTISRQLVLQRLAQPEASSWQIADLLYLPPAPDSDALPTVTVAFCPRFSPEEGDRKTQVKDALVALQGLQYPHLEVLVVEPAPPDATLQNLVQTHYPQFRYLSVPQSGLNWARNAAIQAAQGEIIAFTDERGRVEPGWARALAIAFSENPQVMAVTGLVIPNDLETEAQSLFERGYGWGRGCDRYWQSFSSPQQLTWQDLGTMRLGNGVNMAFRRGVFDQIGGFDPALDVPGATEEGGDLDLFSRVLLAGQTFLYEPQATVRYCPPQTEDQLRSQIAQQTTGFYAYLAAGIKAYPSLRWRFILLGLWKFARLCLRWLRPYGLPRDLIQAELGGVWQGGRAYLAAQRTLPASPSQVLPLRSPSEAQPQLMAVRTVDLNQPLSDLTDVAGYESVRVFVKVNQAPIASIDIAHRGQVISAAQLRQCIADQIPLELLAIPHQHDTGAAWKKIEATLNQYFTSVETQPQVTVPPVLADRVPVTIVITTCDRPKDLENCLQHLQAQITSRPVEIVVTDNRPASGLTPPVIAKFPGVKLVQESRPGGAYGRNAAIAASTGEIIVTIDDDVTVPPDWLEKLIAPLARPEVMAVTGNVLPLELDTPAQILFEQLKGGLSQGFKPKEADGNWLSSFEHCSPPTWELGVSANSAFRASIFSHPQIGLMEETLGPGTPTGGAEENLLVYKILKAGYTLVYEPSAYAWHRHRRDLPAFYRQIYGQLKSCTAYHLVLWLREGDRRGFRQLFFELPRYFTHRIYDRLRGRHQTPWRFLWTEVIGYLVGYWAYWQSCQRVQRQGRSAPYIPVAERRIRSEIPAVSAAVPLVSEPLTMTTQAHVH